VAPTRASGHRYRQWASSTTWACSPRRSPPAQSTPSPAALAHQLPALIAAGLVPKTANVTNTVALWPGYAGGSFGYRTELGRQRRRLIALLAPSVLGALAGGVVLLATPESAFDTIVPFLILFACFLMAFQDQLSSFALHHRLASHGEDHVPVALFVSTFVLAIYGAYFGAGLGILPSPASRSCCPMTSSTPTL
jgi:uncharacterized membrane protein YfcA